MKPEPTWREVFRQGIAPQFSLAGLRALRTALVVDDPRLIQGATMKPEVLLSGEADRISGCCLMAYPFWQGDGNRSHRMVETWAADVAAKLGTSITVFLKFYDLTPRAELFALLLPEVEAVLQVREIEERAACTGSML